MWAALGFGYWLSLLLAVPAAGFLVRLFMIQHDCGHGSFFRRRAANDWVGRAIGALTLTPYDVWRRSHAIHHAGSGNLERRGIGDINTLTVREYLALPRMAQAGLSALSQPDRDVRVRPRLSVSHPASAADRRDARRPAALAEHHGDQRGDRPWRGCHDVAGGRHAVPARAPADHRCWRRPSASGCSTCSISSRTPSGPKAQAWTVHEAALHGSSHYDCRPSCAGSPPTSACTTCIISAAASPTTGCRACCATIPSSARSAGLRCVQSFGCVRLVLWDEQCRRLISFRDLRSVQQASPAPRPSRGT